MIRLSLVGQQKTYLKLWPTEIEAMIDSLIKENPEQAEQYRNGNTKVVGWFVGQMMKASKGKANPQVVGDLLAQKLVGK